MNKKVLLIAGGGTLGRYTCAELVRKGCSVDIICLEDNVSENPAIRYIKANVTLDYLKEFLKERYYDGIVNFIHYTSIEDYKPVHKLLCEKCGHLIFLSSYRVYGESSEPICETTPQLIDTVDDEEFLNSEDYAVPKSLCERYIKNESNTKNWTVVRPVISFSDKRYDIFVAHTPEAIKMHLAEKTPLLLPEKAKNLTAGVDWAGNSGKLIANLLFKENAFGECFTVTSSQNLTWGEVADIYTELCGLKIKWVSVEEYMQANGIEKMPWILKYDRFFDRRTDNTKILKVTGLTKDSFTSVKDGIKIELSKLKEI